MLDDKLKTPCDKIGLCGGCSYREMSYEEQLNDKQKLVYDTIEAAREKISIESGKEMEPYIFEDIIPSPNIYSYRNKMEFSFGDDKKDGPLTLGMHQKKSFFNVVNADNCDLISEDMRLVLKTTLDYFQNKNIRYYHKKSHIGYLRHLVLRRSFYDDSILVNLVTTSQMDLNEEKILLDGYVENILNNNIKIAGIIQTINDSVSDAVKMDSLKIIYGNDYIVDEINGLKFKISPFSFFQTNTKAAEKLYNKIKLYLTDDSDEFLTVYDLYCGTGTISQIVSDVAKNVIGVEIVEEAVTAAKVNAEMNGIKNVSFYAMDVNKYVEQFKNADANDAIILDPPRDGVNANALVKILEFGAKRLVYVSCKISSLARDYEYIHNYGYKLVKLCPVDMFPWTKNVETIALFVKSQ